MRSAICASEKEGLPVPRRAYVQFYFQVAEIEAAEFVLVFLDTDVSKNLSRYAASSHFSVMSCRMLRAFVNP